MTEESTEIPSNEMKTCENCKFAFDPWKERGDKPFECRRFPPIHRSEFASFGDQFPGVNEKDFCGEFVRKENQQ